MTDSPTPSPISPEQGELRKAAERLMSLASKIERASSEDEENALCDERDRLLKLFRDADARRSPPDSREREEDFVDIVFDGPPSHESGRFIEVENAYGKSINFGTWLQRADGYWVLRLSSPRDIRGEALESNTPKKGEGE